MVLESLPVIHDALAPILANKQATDAIWIVGAAVVASTAIRALLFLGNTIYTSFLRPAKKLSKLGKWAIVTGATDGLGKAYAKALAKQGLSVLLISRTQSKLDEVAKEISDKYKVETKTAQVDYSKFSEDVAANLRKTIDSLEVGVLVNNVGISYTYPEKFDKLDEATLRNLVHINCDSVVLMSHMVIGQMDKRKKGAIINVSSASGLFPMGLLTVYSGTKSFVDFFSRALSQEYPNLYIQSVMPFMVVSKLAGLKRPTWNAPTPDDYVRSSLPTIGYEDRTLGYWAHKVSGLIQYLPFNLGEKFTYNTHADINKRYLKRQARITAEAAGKKSQ
ncbi:short-chain dehydrogenase/reductase [Gonapodya prolifera JEL478]|uniref:Short-chain dehydrogenase/reductase n=1 Tax=Gonapodya prolifera (strain JEL478) TaxID=1344416 RepID=A0A139A5Y4_GONPJ|nr:short-chain dehydrogenase/reductase [Gonapodya prolifera JEL478]|eukprot:KXS12197.1 short-chain dehydrogenase/reductase [Gonapodya prolifera JEL478]